jgi:hypothetical protein
MLTLATKQCFEALGIDNEGANGMTENLQWHLHALPSLTISLLITWFLLVFMD